MAVWTVESRYNVVGTAQEPDAAAMIQAAEHVSSPRIAVDAGLRRFLDLEDGA